MASSSADTTSSAPRLKRVLTLWDLIFYGIVLIQPIAPVPLFGVTQKLSDGHFATIILIAMFAMMITAVSYGRMAALYPSAGSAYTYVGKGLNPHLGFLAGWAMFLDYLLQPLITCPRFHLSPGPRSLLASSLCSTCAESGRQHGPIRSCYFLCLSSSASSSC